MTAMRWHDRLKPSANADWIRAMQRTAEISSDSKRTLARVIDEIAARQGVRPALIGEVDRLTYADLAARSHQVSRWALAQGLRAGDRVALVMENHPDYAAIWIGLSGVGVVTALINTQLVGAALLHSLEMASPRHIIVNSGRLDPVLDVAIDGVPVWLTGAASDRCKAFDDALATSDAMPLTADEQPQVTLRDTALLIYTSGTTGLPKAARVSHYRIMMWSEWFAGIMDARSDDRLYNCLPMYHSIGGVVAVGAMLVAGGAIIVRKGFSARRFWDDVAASEATIFQYIGELCRYLLNAPDHPASSRHGLRLCCGNGLRADVWDGFATRFTIPRIIEFYAATEGSFSLFNLEGKPGAIGRIPRFMAHRSPVALVKFDIGAEKPVRDELGFCVRCAPDEPGEAIGLVAAESDGLATRFEGYTSDVDSDRKLLRDVFTPGDVWFRTGDLMKRDAQGFFYFVDRIGDTFRWKGENVATSEVADVIGSCPGVLEANVYGVTVPGADGRACMAALVVTPDFDRDALHAHVATHLPRYARPVFLRLRDSLTITGTFKVRKTDDVHDGFDPKLVRGRLYVDDTEGYRPLDAATYTAIVSGAMRL